jgi:hypothetical protein
MNIIDSFHIHLNSDDAIKYYAGNSFCEFNIRNFEISSQCTIYLSVNHAVIPYSFYNVNSSNNTLNYILNDGATQTVTLSPGNYGIIALLNHLRTLLAADFTITYSTTTNKLTFSSLSSYFRFLSNSTCFGLIGFTDGNKISTLSTLTSDSMVNLSPVRCICIYSSFQTGNITTIAPFNHSILCSIPISVSPFNMIVYHNSSNSKTNIDTNIFNSVLIKIADQNGKVIDLNNIPWSITLQLDIVDFT